ncbi:MAG: Fpg/Nei family DNA glycosylase [Actinomycetota bacterium]
MPELPDVEILRRYLQATSLQRRIEGVFLREQLVEGTSPQTIRRNLQDSALDYTRRHGKHLFAHASHGGWLRLHFGMTGTLQAYSTGSQPEHTELRLDLEDGTHLAYVCTRKLGAISWVGDIDDFLEDHRLGPDPLVDPPEEARFMEMIRSHRGTIKGLLMNQERLAGLGNVYVDEILFQAGIHPRSEASALTEDDAAGVWEATGSVIEGAIERKADPERLPRDWLLPHRSPDERCPVCRSPIERTRVTGRATYSCTGHQELVA